MPLGGGAQTWLLGRRGEDVGLQELCAAASGPFAGPCLVRHCLLPATMCVSAHVGARREIASHGVTRTVAYEAKSRFHDCKGKMKTRYEGGRFVAWLKYA